MARYPHLKSALPTLSLLLVIPSALLLSLSLPLLALSAPELPFYLSKEDATILSWFARHAQPSDIVLAAPDISNLIPAMTDARVYSGHSHETFQPQRKLAQVKAFFEGGMDDAARRQFLQEQGITYVYVRAGAFDGYSADYLEFVARWNNSTLYAVVANGR